jgi:NTE family protein
MIAFFGTPIRLIGTLALALVLAGCETAPKDAALPDARPSDLPRPEVSQPQPQPQPPLVIAPKIPARIGLALGGGAARGFAHVGVIQVLEEAGIRPVLVSGTSAGSLVAAIYASGKNGKQLQRVAEVMEEATFADWTLPLFNRGMLRGDALARYVNGQVGSRLIEDMPLPLGIVATDLNSGQSMLFQRGDTGTAVRASSAVPAVFQPVRISGRDYVDGGLVSPVPVRAARQMGAEIVIAVDISSPPESNLGSGSLDVLLQTFSIMSKSINYFELREADVVVRPALSGIGSSDFSARKRSIEAGRQAMLQLVPQLRAVMAAKMR